MPPAAGFAPLGASNEYPPRPRPPVGRIEEQYRGVPAAWQPWPHTTAFSAWPGSRACWGRWRAAPPVQPGSVTWLAPRPTPAWRGLRSGLVRTGMFYLCVPRFRADALALQTRMHSWTCSTFRCTWPLNMMTGDVRSPVVPRQYGPGGRSGTPVTASRTLACPPATGTPCSTRPVPPGHRPPRQANPAGQ